MFDHIIYFASLAGSITLGSYYKKIEDLDSKRNYGAGLGILITCLICGRYIYHSILMIWGNIIIIKCCDKRYIHQMSLAYTWIYLLYLHYNLHNTIYLIWIHQSLALRLVGLSFELYDNERNKSDPKTSSIKINMGNTDDLFSNPTAINIITYSYFFIGLHKGPYYRWKIFNDHFTTPFGTIVNCRTITEKKLKKVCICAVAYSILRLKYSSKVYYDNDFYERYDADVRYLYNIPHLVMYFLQWQIILTLCTTVATEASFGVYPAKYQPLPGYGTSDGRDSNSDAATQQEYDFSILKCYEKDKILFGPKMKDTLRNWDMPTRYWFWANIYKNLVKSNKEIRNQYINRKASVPSFCGFLPSNTIALHSKSDHSSIKGIKSALSFAAWTIWSGPSIQQFIISSTLWVHIHLESEYADLYNTDTMKLPWNIGFSIMRLFCLIYLTPCFILDDSGVLLKYYNSIFWIYHMILLVLIVGAVVIYKSRVG